MDILSAIGNRIQKIREAKGITQEELEGKTGVNAKYISSVECGQKNATVKTLAKIAKGLDVELYTLFLYSGGLKSEAETKKAIESLLKESDIKTLSLCLEFLKKAI